MSIRWRIQPIKKFEKELVRVEPLFYVVLVTHWFIRERRISGPLTLVRVFENETMIEL